MVGEEEENPGRIAGLDRKSHSRLHGRSRGRGCASRKEGGAIPFVSLLSKFGSGKNKKVKL